MRIMTRNKIGFVDTDSQEEEEHQMGYAEAYKNNDDGIWHTVAVYTLIGIGALSLLKESILFIVNLGKRG